MTERQTFTAPDIRPILVPCGQKDGGKEDAFGALVEGVLGHARALPQLLVRALAENGEDARLHAAKALMLVMLARSELKPAALASAEVASRLARGHGPAERLFAEAAMLAANGAWHAAADKLDAVLLLAPEDALVVKLAHNLRFMLGDKAGMLRSIERTLAGMAKDHPHRGYMLGCHAFALEENHFYARAEAVGREAVARQPRDAWGLHAVSHVHEMTGRFEEGIDWIERHESRLRACNNFGGHLFWHLALFRLEEGNVEEVFALYDREIRAERTDDFRDIANAASLLMRLELAGYAVGARWEELADLAEKRIGDRALIFADLHYMLALMGAGRRQAGAALLAAIRDQPAAYRAQDEVSRRSGVALAEGIHAHFTGRTSEAFTRLASARSSTVLVGGSDAQRDVFEQLLLESALRGGDLKFAARALETRLLARGGRNRLARELIERLERRMPRTRGSLAVMAALAFGRPAS